jgi:hypothetical protein
LKNYCLVYKRLMYICNRGVHKRTWEAFPYSWLDEHNYDNLSLILGGNWCESDISWSIGSLEVKICLSIATKCGCNSLVPV